MSKISPMQRYKQLKEWLPTLKSYRDKYLKNDDPKKGKKFSKFEHRRKVNKHYGAKSN